MKKIFTILFIVIALAALFVSPVFAQGATPPAEGGFDVAYITELLQALILATVPVLAGMAAKWLATQGKIAKEQLTANQMYALEIFIRTAVYAAEQMKASDYIGDKLDYATDSVQMWLDAKNIDMDAHEIRARIEAAVLAEFNSGLLPETENV
jgi:hypothetical protein